MKLSAPKQITFWIAVVVVLIGLLGWSFVVQPLVDYGIWVVAVGFVILALGNLLENL